MDALNVSSVGHVYSLPSMENTNISLPLKLVLSGNSSALAPWYAKLGFVQQIFVASLSSLTSDGGVAPLLDLVVERAFPYGYIDMTKNSQHGMWNEAEERIKAEAWIVLTLFSVFSLHLHFLTSSRRLDRKIVRMLKLDWLMNWIRLRMSGRV